MTLPQSLSSSAPPPPQLDPYFRYALLGIGVVTLLRLAWLGTNPIDLYADEAQYWLWAQQLSPGYFSKPPMIVWLIAATTGLMGNDEFAIKLAAPMLYIGTSLLVFALSARLYGRRTAAWTAIAFVTLPAVSLSALIISTDVPLLFCWALASYGLFRARAEGGRWWWLVGLAAGLGLLSKYAMGFWLGSVLGFILLMPGERRHLKGFLVGLAVAVLVYSPNFFWNAANHFVSYAHTEANANLHGFALHPGAFAVFALSQFAVFGPIFLVCLILIAVNAARGRLDRDAALLLTLALPTLSIMLVEAMLSRAQPNWSAPTYISATILVVGWLSRQGREALVQWSVVLHIGFAVLALGLGSMAQAIGHPLPGKLDPLHRVHGWRRLGQAASESAAEHPDLPILGDEREFMAEMTYYMQPHPFAMKMWNPGHSRRNGFEMSQSLPDQPGGDYLWVTGSNRFAEVFARFASHEQLRHITVPIGPGLNREAWIYVLRGFQGYSPAPAP